MSTEVPHPPASPGVRDRSQWLLMWVILLSLTQAVTMILLFIWVKPGQVSDPLSKSPSQLFQPTKPPDESHFPAMEWVLNNASSKASQIKWSATSLGYWPRESSATILTVPRDGQYFLYAQITLQTEEKGVYTVKVWKDTEVLLEREFSNNGTSVPATSHFLGRQVLLSHGNKLYVTCSPPALLNTIRSMTFLGAYLLQPH